MKCTMCYIVHSLTEDERELLRQDKLRLLFTTTGRCSVCGKINEIVSDHEIKSISKGGTDI